MNIKTSKHCENLLRVSNKLKQYVKYRIVKSHENVFPMGTAIK